MTGDVVDPEHSRGEEYPEDEDYSGDEGDDFDCGMCVDRATGELLGCQLAGTEQCDWECPYREEFSETLPSTGSGTPSESRGVSAVEGKAIAREERK